MAILTSSRNFTYESHIKAPVQEVIAFLQDAPSLASQSPVFISIHPDTSTTEPYWHVITERVPIVGSIETSTRIRVRFLPTAEGVSCTVRASLGVRMQTDYVVEEKSEGESLLKESTTMKHSSKSSAVRRVKVVKLLNFGRLRSRAQRLRLLAVGQAKDSVSLRVFGTSAWPLRRDQSSHALLRTCAYR
ncbi:hypothetical protein DFP72DRAFT_847438 [Ephemerocybe angulata]|uniref:DUF7053 domain-containing protein n=1 Tax=Ephemerocybe angulata TaxID=980116 RepID=A0A8H6HZ68_9AGAR|nr:hypothetical protein DFP72DRAFT_847438 [Tulosesus angulatus]